jgi:uncharacterized protein YoxC
VAAWAQILLVACAVALTVALVTVLLALRRATLRAEGLLGLVEREVRPLTSELTALLVEARGVSQRANKEMERVGAVVDRVEGISIQASRLAQAVSGLTRVGQAVALLVGLRRGAGVFVKRLRQ